MSPGEAAAGPRQPEVSVVMPVYNGARYVGVAIESVLEQTFHDFELVVVNDASTDDSAAVIATFNDPRIRAYDNAQNLGMTGNWNRSVSLARGRYVTMLHQDDQMLPDNLSRKLEILRGGSGRWVASDCFQIGSAGEVLHEHWFRHRQASAFARYGRFVQFMGMFFGDNYLCFTTLMWDRALMAHSGPFTDAGRYCADVHMWLKMLYREPIVYLNERLVRYRWAQNLSLRYDEDKWDIADFLARQAAAEDLSLPWPYRALLRLQYGGRFLFRVAGHALHRRVERRNASYEGLRLVLSATRPSR